MTETGDCELRSLKTNLKTLSLCSNPKTCHVSDMLGLVFLGESVKVQDKMTKFSFVVTSRRQFIVRVVKFGGSSLANGSQFAKVVAIMKANPARQVIVTSAPGKRHPGDTKVTDLLIQYAQAVMRHEAVAAIVAEIVARYQAIADDFELEASIMAAIEEELDQLPKLTFKNNDYLMAGFKARGEKLNAFLMTAVLNHEGIEATYGEPKSLGIVVTDHPNDAEVSRETYRNLATFRRPIGVLVVPGFYGYTSDDDIATFSRGGSDITGAILANGFHADLYENFTDVDGVAAADPRVVANPQMIREMTYREMRELSYGGFGVFHDEAILPAIAGQVPINLKTPIILLLPGP